VVINNRRALGPPVFFCLKGILEMAAQIFPTVPVAQAAAAPWPDDSDQFSIRIDEMFARKLDTEFAAGVRGLLHDPETGLSSLSGEAALEAIAGIYPALEALRQRTLSEAIGPRQRALVEPAINTRLDWAAGAIGRLAESATVEVDDASVAERIAGLRQDAETSWHDPAWLKKLGRTTVTELRWQGERRGWDEAETETRARAGLSDLYASAVEAAIAKDLDGAASLLAHAREAIDPARRETIDHRLARARENGFLREVDAALSALPLDPAAPPALDAFAARTVELTPNDATDEVRTRLGELAAHAQRRAERQWHRRQAEAGIEALDWLQRNPTGSWLGLPPDLRDWLAPDQVAGLETLLIDGRLRTDPDLFERLDREMVYEPDDFADRDLDRQRLSLDDQDHARFAGAQKAVADGATDPAFACWRLARLGIDRALDAEGIDTFEPEAVQVPVDPSNASATQAGPADEGPTPPFADDPNIVRVGGGSNSTRRGGGHPLTPFEQMRIVSFQSALNAIRQLEPGNRELSYIAPRGWVPAERDVARVQEELVRARQRVASSGNSPSSSNDATASNEAFHYTFRRVQPLIEANGLRAGSYATTTSTLSPLQAHIDLALPPNRGLPGAIFRIDLNGLRGAGFEIPVPTRVTRSYGMPGGGHEMQFPYDIPPQYLKVIK